MLAETSGSEPIKNIDFLAPPTGMKAVDFPRGTVVTELGDNRTRVGALRLFQGMIRSSGEGEEYVDGSVVIFELDGVRNPVQVHIANHDLTGNDINIAGDITERFLRNQRQISLAKSLLNMRSVKEEEINRGNSDIVIQGYENMLARRNVLIQEAGALGITLIETPDREGFTKIPLSSVEVKARGVFSPEAEELLKRLNIELDDPVRQKFEYIVGIFNGLRRPREQRIPLEESPDAQDFVFGIHYYPGRYAEASETIRQNARSAKLEGANRVAPWKTMKSVAFSINGEIFIVHVRGDHQVNESRLAEILKVNREDIRSADKEQLDRMGLEHGTVNPFITDVTHLFDQDLIEGEDYPEDDLILTSSGDSRFYLAFNIRNYLAAKGEDTVDISLPLKDAPKRMVPRAEGCIIGGDSSKDTDDMAKAAAAAAITILDSAKPSQYYGDRSVPKIEPFQDRELAGSFDTGLYGMALREHVRYVVLPELALRYGGKKRRPVFAFNSAAMDGLVGDMMRETKWLNYVGRREAVGKRVSLLKEQGIIFENTVLLGLPSVYDNRLSAFAGEILDNALPIDSTTEEEELIQNFVQEYKIKGARIKQEEFYSIIKNILKAAHPQGGENLEGLKGKNVAVILGASELDSFITNQFQRPSDPFTAIIEGTPADTARKIKDASAATNKVRLVFISPLAAVADEFARRTLGLAS